MERLKGGRAVDDGITFRKFAAQDLDWLVESHATLYAREEGFDDSFGPLVAEIARGFLVYHEIGKESGWIAEHDGHRLGCIFCVRADREGFAKLRLFLVLPEARGFGLGQRLLDTCMGFARGVGYEGMTLWTHKSHEAACALYAKNGWRCVAERPVHSFGCDLVEQTWEIVF